MGVGSPNRRPQVAACISVASASQALADAQDLQPTRLSELGPSYPADLRGQPEHPSDPQALGGGIQERGPRKGGWQGGRGAAETR